MWNAFDVYPFCALPTAGNETVSWSPKRSAGMRYGHVKGAAGTYAKGKPENDINDDHSSRLGYRSSNYINLLTTAPGMYTDG